ncbi:MAG: hybrid sensor histidine kinase/response regulator [Magnetococcales bacterium]|nr:hybrid sensor histidine kinase/response regulator [Magnetococcales bacterium]
MELRKRLLIVDDEPLNLNLLVNLFESKYDLLVAKDGHQALNRAVKADPPPDLILLDIMMPGMDGYEVCRQIKANPKISDIPVIFITALNDEREQLKGFEIGAVDFITKPFLPTVVKARVRTHLSHQSAIQLAHAQNESLLRAAHLREDVDRILRHDLKSPLQGILGAADLLREEGLREEQRSLVDMIEAAGYRMLDMINSSLDLYKMEIGRYQPHPHPVTPIPLLHKVLAEAAQQIKANHLTTTIQCQEKRLLIHGEESLCYSLFGNLIKNAVEASPRGATVTITLERDGQRVRIAIHNQGAVPPEIRPVFFEKYITAGKSHGTGIGTYSARLMTETQGGTIAFTTSEEQGTTVTVWLPRVADA